MSAFRPATRPAAEAWAWTPGGRALILTLLACLFGSSPVLEAAAPAGQWWNASYRYRQKLSLTAGATAIPTQYSVRLQFSHAALVGLAQSLASGNDVRVAWWNGSGWVELDRRLDDQSAWNNAATRIWFRTQAGILASATDDNYYLYYGYSGAGVPPTNWANVFLFYDDFNDGVFDGARWVCTDPYNVPPAGAVCTESAIAPGTMSIGDNAALASAALYAFGTNTRWESRLRVATNFATNAAYNYWGASDNVGPGLPYTGDWMTFWASTTFHRLEVANNGSPSSSAPAPAIGTPTAYHVYTMDREGATSVRFRQDGTQVGNIATNVPDANLRVFAFNDDNASPGEVLDWVRVRKYVTPEPTLAAAAAELASPTASRVSGCVVRTAIGAGDDWGYDVAVQPDGKVVVGGYFEGVANRDMAALRYTADLRLDTSFDSDGLAVMDIWGHDHAESVAIQADGRIVLGGTANQNGLMGCCDEFAAARFNTNGSADTAGFGPPNGHVSTNVTASWDLGRALVVQTDGKILLGGYVDDGAGNWNFGLVRYNANGSLDTAAFNPTGAFGIAPNSPGMVVTSVRAGSDYGNALVVQPDGRILFAGASWNGTNWDWAIVRYNANGSLDGSFGTGGIVTTDLRGSDDWANAIALQPDGKILVGAKSSNGTDTDFAVARYSAGGSLDASFGTGGMVFTPIGAGNDEGEKLALQPDGKIVVAGYTWTGSDDDFAVVRYNSNGTLDSSFGSGGKVVTRVGTGNDSVHGIALQPDGKILLVGDSHNGSNLDIALARYLPSGSLDGSCGVNYRSIGTALDYGTAQPVAQGGGTTVTATLGSAVVTGSAGVAWRTANRGRGDRIRIGGVDYTVAGVDTENQLRLTIPYLGSTASGLAYTIARQFATLAAWETCIDGNPCAFFPVASASLVADDRSEVGIAYKDSVLSKVDINGSLTDATHTITLTADPGNRHLGVAGAGVVVDGAAAALANVLVQDDYVTVEWLEIKGGADEGIEFQNLSLSPGPGNKCVVRDLLVHNTAKDGILIDAATATIDVYNNIVYATAAGSTAGIWVGTTLTTGTVRLFNNTVYGNTRGIVAAGSNPGITLRNNLALGNPSGDYNVAGRNAASSNNVASDASGTTNSPAGGGIDNVTATASPTICGTSCVGFSSITPGSENLHLIATTYPNRAVDTGANLSSVMAAFDIDAQSRVAPWDVGADDLNGTTAVKLQSFSAVPGDGSVLLEWRTGSELANLGFHLYRGWSEGGPWTRLTSSLIPGLGSSAVGQGYSFRDTGLVNGTRYFYRLEDVDASSKTTSHGPVSAVPQGGSPGEIPGSEPGASGGKKQGVASSGCPDWVLAAYGSSPGASSDSLSCTRHGDPEAVGLELVSRDARQATLELRTGGFYALYEASGTVRVFVAGFDFPQDAAAAALPFRRALVDAVVGRRVELGGVRAWDQVGYRGLVPSALGEPQMQVSRDGTVRAGRRALRATRRAVRERVPERSGQLDLARLLPSVFQGETKSAVVEISPLRFDARRQQIVLAKRVRVRLLFTGREPGESGRGSIGRRERPPKPVSGELLARLYTTGRGLYAVAFEQVFAGRRRGVSASQLRLERQGEAVGIHVEPASDVFGPGSVLYFHADTTTSSTDFSSETAWELLRARDGITMPLVSAAPSGEAVMTASTRQASFEVNRFYQPGLLEAPELWLWEALASGATRVEGFSLAGVDAASSQAAKLEVLLQGASESGNAIDHHVSVSLNGALVGETQFAGKKPHRMSLSVPVSLLREGANELQLTNVGDTGVSSLVFLDRFMLVHPQASLLAGGRFEGTWSESGTASVAGVGGAVAVVDVTQDARWLTGYENAGGWLRFRVEAGHRYWAGSASALFSPRVSPVQPSGLKSAGNQADYLLIAPRAFLAAAEPLLQRRHDQGLATRAVAFEEIAEEFGHGQPSAEAIQSFLAYAYQSWARPSPRYVLLLGDSSYDPRNFTGMSQPSPLPALWTKTSYLWTASDPLLAAVNGEDALPDLAIGRLPATTVEEATSLVQKLLAWEDSGQGLEGAAALVADNPDLAGDFEADVRDIAQSYLAARNPLLLLLRELGAGTRPAIRDALDSGLSLLSYVGHGGAAVWASENVWNSWDAASLLAQSRQPFLMTMNCLNGYFVAPSFNSLAESLLKVEGRGAIASFSPSGLSEDGPAHQYHRALMAELTNGRHERLGDALLAAQKAYAQTGLMPELLSVYHLLGDPAMRVR